jgi:hypothetical protein
MPKQRRTWRYLRHRDDASVRFQIREAIQRSRLCMAAQRCTQRNNLAALSKGFRLKRFLRVAQICHCRAANKRATFPFCRPI